MTAQKDGYVLKLVPRYAVFSLVFAFLWNSLIYNGAIALQRGRPALDMTTALEDAIPFQPGWIVVYFGCFLFWGVNYILISSAACSLSSCPPPMYGRRSSEAACSTS